VRLNKAVLDACLTAVCTCWLHCLVRIPFQIYAVLHVLKYTLKREIIYLDFGIVKKHLWEADMTVTTVVVCLFGNKEELIIYLKHLWGLAEQSKTFPYDRNRIFLSLKDIQVGLSGHIYMSFVCACVRSCACMCPLIYRILIEICYL